MSAIDDLQNLDDSEAAEHGSDRSLRDVLGELPARARARAPQHQGAR